MVRSGQTCVLKSADDFFGLLFASQERRRNELRLIRTYKIPEMCELRARQQGVQRPLNVEVFVRITISRITSGR